MDMNRDAELLKNSDVNIAIAENFYVDGTSLSESSVEGFYAAGDILASSWEITFNSRNFPRCSKCGKQGKTIYSTRCK